METVFTKSEHIKYKIMTVNYENQQIKLQPKADFKYNAAD